MNRLPFCVFFIAMTIVISGCARNVPIEDLTIPLVLGIDLDEEDNLLFFQSSPIFNKDTKDNSETLQLKAKSIRESRKYFDALATGEVTAAKIQVFLIGKRILEHENWFPTLDTLYRNPNFSPNMKIVMVDGPVKETIFVESKSKPQTSLFLKDVIEYNIKRTRNVEATSQKLHRQMYEKGITPSISQIRKDGEQLKLVGVALLDKKGKYRDTLGLEESSLLLLLQDDMQQELTLSIPIKELDEEEGIFNKNEVSFSLERVKTKIKTSHKNGRFRFKYTFQMYINIAERLFPEDKLSQEEMEKILEKELTERFEKLIERFQEQRLDPIGLGIHARAYQYKEFKKVENHWPEAFANADVDISVDIKIKTMGAIR